MSMGILAGCSTTTVEEAGEGDETIHVFLYMQEHEKEGLYAILTFIS